VTAAPTLPSAYLEATRLLQDATQALASFGRPPVSETYVASGDFAWDCCDAMAVHVKRVRPLLGPALTAQGAQKRPPASCGTLWGADVDLYVLRCVRSVDESGNPPTGGQIDEDAFNVIADATALLSALTCDSSIGGCSSRGLDGYRLVGPKGGCLAVVLPLRLPLGTAR
jgi:hypothetical protein